MSEQREHDDRARLEAELEAAEADLRRLRAEHAAIGERLREEPGEEGRAERRRAAAAMDAARDRARLAEVQLKLLELRGSPYGLIGGGGEVLGVIAVAIPKGASSAERVRCIAAELTPELVAAGRALGAVPSASAERYTRERPGRDAEGKTVLDVAARVEGDLLVPAVTKPGKAGKG